MDSGAPERTRLLGVEIDLVTPDQVLDWVQQRIAAGGAGVVANHNTHSVYLLRREPALAAFFAGADIIQIDSRPMILWGQMLGLPVRGAHRSTYLDWRDAFWRRAVENGWRVFYLGGAPGVAEAARTRLLGEFPDVSLAVHDGYFDASPGSADNGAVLDALRAFDPDIVLVGMGMPRQEHWIVQNRDSLARGVFFSVGAAFDYEAGAQSAAPRWMGRLGVEWLYRLATQPVRLGFRYLVEPWFLLPAAFGDVTARLRRRPDALAGSRIPGQEHPRAR